MTDQMKCLKCNGEMEEGVISETQQAQRVAQWGVFHQSNILNRIENQVKIVAYRCKSCGYIESYAK